jgi:NTE family protein
MLNVNDYRNSTQALIDHLQKKFPEGIYVSDIRDNLGKQYVDLVQEGGGVHGIALAGYTYVLEKMNIGFSKMAGTSAGSINTLLLNAVCTAKEAKAMGIAGDYHETRSEKVVEYLSNQDLRNFVDGPKAWQKLILGMFTPQTKRKGIKGFIKEYKNLLSALLFLMFVIIAAGFLVLYDQGELRPLWVWSFRISFVILTVISIVLYMRIRNATNLARLFQKFGINPGEKFEQWIETILTENSIRSLDDLSKKFEREKQYLNPHYQATRKKNPDAFNEISDLNVGVLLKNIEDPGSPVDAFYEPLCDVFYLIQYSPSERKAKVWDCIMSAFETRLAHDNVVTKELVIVSSDITHGLKVEFPGMHRMYWGNDRSISPARYVRASMSVPVFFKPMEVVFDPARRDEIRKAWNEILKVQNDPGERALFVDGGLLSNFPINVFYNASMPVPRKPTFGIKLEYENEIESKTIKSFVDFGGSIINTMRFFYDRDFALKQDLYKKTVRSVDTGDIHWLNFNLTDKEKLELFYRGALAATIFLSKHASTEREIKALLDEGKRVPSPGGSFSIYKNDSDNFRTEDLMMKNITFEWQSYKLERLLDRLAKDEKKGWLKNAAAGKTP